MFPPPKGGEVLMGKKKHVQTKKSSGSIFTKYVERLVTVVTYDLIKFLLEKLDQIL